MDKEILEKGLTHPQIHLDFYEWFSNLSEFDKEFLKTKSPKAIAMWAWSSSRESLKKKASSK